MAPRKRSQVEDDEEVTTEQAPQNEEPKPGEDTLDEEDDSGFGRDTEANGTEPVETPDDPAGALARIEAKLDQILEHVSPEGQNRAQMERTRKVPYIPPQLPEGLSPNQRLNHPLVRNQGMNPEIPVAPMRSETEPAEVPGSEDDPNQKEQNQQAE